MHLRSRKVRLDAAALAAGAVGWQSVTVEMAGSSWKIFGESQGGVKQQPETQYKRSLDDGNLSENADRNRNIRSGKAYLA